MHGDGLPGTSHCVHHLNSIVYECNTCDYISGSANSTSASILLVDKRCCKAQVMGWTGQFDLVLVSWRSEVKLHQVYTQQLHQFTRGQWLSRAPYPAVTSLEGDLVSEWGDCWPCSVSGVDTSWMVPESSSQLMNGCCSVDARMLCATSLRRGWTSCWLMGDNSHAETTTQTSGPLVGWWETTATLKQQHKHLDLLLVDGRQQPRWNNNTDIWTSCWLTGDNSHAETTTQTSGPLVGWWETTATLKQQHRHLDLLLADRRQQPRWNNNTDIWTSCWLTGDNSHAETTTQTSGPLVGWQETTATLKQQHRHLDLLLADRRQQPRWNNNTDIWTSCWLTGDNSHAETTTQTY